MENTRTQKNFSPIKKDESPGKKNGHETNPEHFLPFSQEDLLFQKSLFVIEEESIRDDTMRDEIETIENRESISTNMQE